MPDTAKMVQFDASTLVEASIQGGDELQRKPAQTLAPDDCCRIERYENYEKDLALRLGDDKVSLERPAAGREDIPSPEKIVIEYESSALQLQEETKFSAAELVQGAVEGQRAQEALVASGESPARVTLDCCASQPLAATSDFEERSAKPLEVKVVSDSAVLVEQEKPLSVSPSTVKLDEPLEHRASIQNKVGEALGESPKIVSGLVTEIGRRASDLRTESPIALVTAEHLIAREPRAGIDAPKPKELLSVEPAPRSPSDRSLRQQPTPTRASESKDSLNRIDQRSGPAEREIQSYIEKLSSRLTSEVKGRGDVRTSPSNSVARTAAVLGASVQYRREPIVARVVVGPNALVRTAPAQNATIKMQHRPAMQRMLARSRQVALARMERLYRVQVGRLHKISERIRALQKLERSPSTLAEIRKLKLSGRLLISELRQLKERFKIQQRILRRERNGLVADRVSKLKGRHDQKLQLKKIVRDPMVLVRVTKGVLGDLKTRVVQRLSTTIATALRKISLKLAPKSQSLMKLNPKAPRLDQMRMQLARRLQSILQSLEVIRLSTYSQHEALEMVEELGTLKRKSEVRALAHKRRISRRIKRRHKSSIEEDSQLKLGARKRKGQTSQAENSKAPVLGISTGAVAKVVAKRRIKDARVGPKKTLDLFQAEQDDSDSAANEQKVRVGVA